MLCASCDRSSSPSVVHHEVFDRPQHQKAKQHVHDVPPAADLSTRPADSWMTLLLQVFDVGCYLIIRKAVRKT